MQRSKLYWLKAAHICACTHSKSSVGKPRNGSWDDMLTRSATATGLVMLRCKGGELLCVCVMKGESLAGKASGQHRCLRWMVMVEKEGECVAEQPCALASCVCALLPAALSSKRDHSSSFLHPDPQPPTSPVLDQHAGLRDRTEGARQGRRLD